jgi:DNA-binding beta-propeller fold protein YncE
LFVTNAADSSLSVFDAGTMTLEKTLTLNHDNPAAIAMPSSGSIGYVIHHVRDGAVSTIDLDQGSVIAEWPVARYPRSGVVGPTGSRLYLVHGDVNQLVTLEVVGQSYEFVSSVSLPEFPNSVAVNADESEAFVALADPWDRSSSAVARVDLKSKEISGILALPDFPARMAMDADREELYVAAASGIAVIDTRGFRLVGTFGSGAQFIDVALGPDGKMAFFTDFSRHEVAVFDRDEREVVAFVPVGARPLGIDAGMIESDHGEPAPCTTIGLFPTRTPTASPSATPTPPLCSIGDCDRDGQTTLPDLTVALEVALLRLDVGACPCIDRDSDGRATADEIVAAVAHGTGRTDQARPEPTRGH